MTGFSSTWLALRERADHRARNPALAQRLAALLLDKAPLRVIDLGCGTGSNLRASAPFFGPQQEWTLVDYDPALLEAAAHALNHWADEAKATGDQLLLIKGEKQISVRFRIADLDRELEAVLAPKADLVTASALFDLISPEWMARFAKALQASKALFYTVLTYDGQDRFTPPHALDEAVVAAFAHHQKSDKGFGIAAGPEAASCLVKSLRAVGYAVETADSPWLLRAADEALALDLLDGIAFAVRETGKVPDEALNAWLAFRKSAARLTCAELMTGHQDILALSA